MFKSATIDYREWSLTAFGRHSPWGDADSPALISEIETALERELSRQIMRGHAKPTIRRLRAGDILTRQGEAADEVFLLLDGLLRVEVDGEQLAEVGPGAVIGERALLETGKRTASLAATTACAVAVADQASVDFEALREVSHGHHREDSPRAGDGGRA
jgi:CRP-like cAMP-binding protein